MVRVPTNFGAGLISAETGGTVCRQATYDRAPMTSTAGMPTMASQSFPEGRGTPS